MKKAKPQVDVKVKLRGNVSTMRRHIKCDTDLIHWEVYERGCQERNISVHPTATPTKVLDGNKEKKNDKAEQ